MSTSWAEAAVQHIFPVKHREHTNGARTYADIVVHFLPFINFPATVPSPNSSSPAAVLPVPEQGTGKTNDNLGESERDGHYALSLSAVALSPAFFDLIVKPRTFDSLSLHFLFHFPLPLRQCRSGEQPSGVRFCWRSRLRRLTQSRRLLLAGRLLAARLSRRIGKPWRRNLARLRPHARPRGRFLFALQRCAVPTTARLVARTLRQYTICIHASELCSFAVVLRRRFDALNHIRS